ncbi:hypothetical protein K440DRAFT_617037 [Wilcoxina mikolae CBS 423.85]|nr:hypothetical protein K440DRAFT_617037 [Wilcoxina mikolae CBS 423.85]
MNCLVIAVRNFCAGNPIQLHINLKPNTSDSVSKISQFTSRSTRTTHKILTTHNDFGSIISGRSVYHLAPHKTDVSAV